MHKIYSLKQLKLENNIKIVNEKKLVFKIKNETRYIKKINFNSLKIN